MGRVSGVLICIEGIDGCGKTTHARRLVRSIRKMGFKVVYTTEPTDGLYGRIIKQRILDADEGIQDAVVALLFAVDRLDHLEKEIKPLLRKGMIVICDRYLHSSIAYQGAAGLDIEWVRTINRYAVAPDLAVYIDVFPEIGLKRIAGGRRLKSSMESLENLEAVRAIYHRLVESNELISIDGTAPFEVVAERILKAVREYLTERRQHGP
ncbi:MAG: dTMP kinase [Candidatus Bathyarchaeota archaeon]|nr:MAG: dTMP kinase [Candidatus Bathyarchaeota archaeon]